MRILIVLPRQEEATGNEVTAARHAAGLAVLGHQVLRERVTLEEGASLRAAARAFAPDVIHLLHAYRSGRPWLEAGLEDLPCVVTLTGTDINGGIDSDEEGPIIHHVLAIARKIITPNAPTADSLRCDFPSLANRLTSLPPGIMLGTAPSPWTRAALAPPGTILFLHPAGIRPIKGNGELLDLFDPLAMAGLPFVVAFCGPPLHPGYSADFFAALAPRPWARYLGVIPPAAIPATLRQIDIVLNNSQSEGLPNALLEAAALGVPILARDIPGNAAVVKAEVNGLLYHDACSFAHQARALMEDPGLRRRLSCPCPERYAPEKETQALVALYNEVLGRRLLS